MSESVEYAVGQGDLGCVLVATSALGVCAILLGDSSEDLHADLTKRFAAAPLTKSDACQPLVAAVVAFIAKPKVGLDLALDAQGTAFQKRVWEALQEVPVGSTVTYTDIAKRIAAPTSARAVAQACAANPVALAIPCHRVLRTDGGLSGYRWGVERKRQLLAREYASVPLRLTRPAMLT